MESKPVREWPTELRQVAPGAYAYVQALGQFGGPKTSAGISNAGLVLGPDGAMVIDTLNAPSHTKAFLKEIGTTTTLPLRHVVLTHVHGDHTHGIQFFPDSDVISHELCRQQLIDSGQEAIDAYARSRPHWTEEMLAETLLALPNVTMTDRMVFYYGDREVQLVHKGPAHTDNDVIVFLPQERLLYAGDLAFYWVAPLSQQGDFENWVRVIDELMEMPVDVIVPGHGPVGTKEDLVTSRAFIVRLVEEGKRCYQAGYSVQEAAQRADLGEFSTWPDTQERRVTNLATVYRRLGANV